MEYAALRNDEHCPKGMYVLPSADSLLAWDAVLFVHQDCLLFQSAYFGTANLSPVGYYTDAVLKFCVRFPPTYPSRAPEVTFATDVFHPLISSDDGIMNVAPRFAPWRPKQDHVFHLLHWIKAAFKKEILDNLKEVDCPNKEAFRYHDSTHSFAALATQSSMLSQSAPTLFESAHYTSSSAVGTGIKGQQRQATQGIFFHETHESELDPLRSRLGLRPWTERAKLVNS
ncbi:hypothetical protein EW145_g908 [Phellinidium pouzarii]|uniref:UBC core domain-containing protein n=1 Tax=Phellinidium pouzarii TaxID=167371 RepID=A0A4S4LH30_9AGAM|nr:hypothetical protein EW145_g908 [Phellinidium pouzarii]